MTDLLDHLRAYGEQIEADLAAGVDRDLSLIPATAHPRPRRPWWLIVAAAAVLVGVLSFVVVVRHEADQQPQSSVPAVEPTAPVSSVPIASQPPAQRPNTVPTPAPPTTLDDRTFDPLSGEVYAIKIGADGPLFDTIPFAITEGGVRAEPSTTPMSDRPPTGQQYVDLYRGVGTFLTATCCDTNGSGTVWAQPDVVGTGTRIDHLEPANAEGSFSNPLVFADPVGGTVNLSGTNIAAPGVIDVAIASPSSAAVLMGGAAPRLLIYLSETGGEPWKLQTEFDVSAGACRIAALGPTIVVFSGAPAQDPASCSANYGTAYDFSGNTLSYESNGDSLTAEFAMPVPITDVDSDHSNLMVARTTAGDLWIGTLEPQPKWYRIAQGQYVAVDVWGSGQLL